MCLADFEDAGFFEGSALAKRIIIIGAGAAGLATAIFAAESLREAGHQDEIILLDGMKKVGLKILVAGGGRCNVTHDKITPSLDYNGPKNVVKNVIKHFDEKAARDWFEGMGVQLKVEETGKLFPVTDSAKTVLDALLNRCEELGVQLITGAKVKRVERAGESNFTVGVEDGRSFDATLVVFATGGKSLPKSGSDGTGWQILQRLGHSVGATYPALVPMTVDSQFFHAGISGIAQDLRVRVLANGKKIHERVGALLWTHFGISGPVVMDASRHWVKAKAEGAEVKFEISLLPEQSFEQVEAMFLADGGRATQKVMKQLQFMPTRVACALCDYVGVDGRTKLSDLKKDDRRKMVRGLTELAIPIAKARGWEHAEVTAGGVPMSEVDCKTMGSRLVDDLYLVGECLDVEGRIGGFNFQWAWATGKIAGEAIGKRIGDG